MSNPLIVVNMALYGTPDVTPLDLTGAIQALFDSQYQAEPARTSFSLNNIGPALFGIHDPAPGKVKTLTLVYTLPGSGPTQGFARGGCDGDSITLTVEQQGTLQVDCAVYCTNTLSLDLTDKLRRYLADPSNSRSLTIGSAAFFAAFCHDKDPAPGIRKCFQLTYRNSPASRALSLCGSDGDTIAIGPNPALPNQNWMTQLATSKPGFNQLHLGQICLPAVHDAGTYQTGDAFTSDPQAWVKDVMDTVKSVTDKLDVIPGISKFIDPAAWVHREVLAQTRALATATHADILQQLNDGMRCLDLRVYYNHADAANPFYTYHGLVGLPLSSVLAQVANFLTTLAPDGEIVYLTLGHYHDDTTPGNSFTAEQIGQLSALIWSYFPDRSRVFGPNDAQQAGNPNLLACTYGTIVNTTAGKASKVVLVMQNPLQQDQGKVWNTNAYSPPDAGAGSQFAGAYTNTDQYTSMIPSQQSNAAQAKTSGKSLALYLTLTPQNKEVTILICGSLAKAIGVLAAEVALVPFLGWGIAAALGVVAAGLAIAGATADYHSLEELSGQIFTDNHSTLQTLYQVNFSGSDYASPGFIYMDFYESHRMNDVAGHSVAQVVELAKSLTKAQVQPSHV